MYSVYCYTNKFSGRRYIGVTCNVERRKSHHARANGQCRFFHSAVQKHGISAFDFFLVLETESRDLAYFIENISIREEVKSGRAVYNLTDGGRGGIPGFRHSKESRNKMSAAKKGIEFSDEWRANLSASKKGNTNTLGFKASKKTRESLSAALKGNKNSLGFKHSQETIRKRALAISGRPLSDEHRSRIANAKSKFSKDQKAEIARRCESGEIFNDVAALFSVHHSTIRRIFKRYKADLSTIRQDNDT